MHIINLRGLFHLHWSKVVITGFLILLLASSYTATSQGLGYRRKHLEYYDDKPLHYGILFAIPFTRYNFSHSDDFLTRDTSYLIESPTTTAFRMGFTINAYLTDHFDLRTTPSVSLYERQMKFSYPGGTEKIQKRESTWVEIPLLLKYKSNRRVNSRMYMIAGITMSIETNVKRNRGAGSGTLDTKTSDFTVDYGIGYEQFFEFFKFAPELRFSHGLSNVLQPSANSTTSGIKRLTTHTVTLYLNFE
ncbi:hypothetical protein DYBT9275_05138 [Dyadobacter sp. CECT 9275]|uniref:Outer membrane protein beta-barrel domain-containing protein n=1 Tax=Dyadobacter helix TaxID=2822344 RepID=A0A916JGE3_9BACT|nr:porin family protein [Dyadobacter sp. CECT 9275]CAG5012251.1 hypothetical protein DYBT9275_05138 [Dyadobacter sp. CECT 9275]